MTFARSFGSPAVLALVAGATLGVAPLEANCPAQNIQNLQAACGQEYGALVTFCYNPAPYWWFKENVVSGPGDCQGGDIDQTTNPFQSVNSCVGDEVLNNNGPAGDHAPCTDTTFQTIFAGPTQPLVEQCPFANTQLIEVTLPTGNPPGAVKTTITPTAPPGAAQSVACPY
jgi:hypothetical protein